MRHPAFAWAIAFTCLAGASARGADDPPKAQGKPEGKEVKLLVTRDTWFSQVGNEANCNLGGSSQLKLKSLQEMSLIDVDPKAIKGHVINGATLYLRSKGQPHLKRSHHQFVRVRLGRGHVAVLRGTEGQLHVQRPQASRRTVDHSRQRPRRRHARAGRDTLADGRRFSAGR